MLRWAVVLAATAPLAVLAGATIVLADSGTTTSSDIAEVTFTNQVGGLCLTDDSAGKSGGQADLWKCDGATTQEWLLDNTAQDGVYTLKSAASGLCLDAENDTARNPAMNGDPVRLVTCNGNANQTWLYGQIDGFDWLQTGVGSGENLLLTAMSDSTHNPSTDTDPVVLWQWTQQSTQYFYDGYGPAPTTTPT